MGCLSAGGWVSEGSCWTSMDEWTVERGGRGDAVFEAVVMVEVR